AGIGKSAILEAAAAEAGQRGFRVLWTAGVEAESELAFAGLQRLLRPILPTVDGLPVAQRDVLLAALGLAGHDVPGPFLVALAALEILSAEAARRPLVVIADDLHWLDSASTDVITFVA